MKYKVISAVCLLFVVSIVTSQARQDEFCGLKGPYMGQDPPGLEPVIFAPGIISTAEFMEASCTFSPDGKEIYFTRGKSFQDRPEIMVSRMEKEGWTVPRVASFSGVHFDFEPNITPDGKKMFFMRFDPKNKSIKRGLWVMERINSGWGKPVFHSPGMFATSTLNGTLYYTITDKNNRGIVRSHLVMGRYTEPEYVFGGVNNPTRYGHPCVSPDESFLILDGRNPDFGNKGDLYVCFRNSDGSWGKVIPFGNKLNYAHKNCASLSPDGKYLFYTHFKSNSETDIYWVDTKVIGELKSKELK